MHILTLLQDAGANLDFILARRVPENLGKGILFVTPLRGDAEVTAAANLGFNVTNGVHTVRVEGVNKPGIVAKITEELAAVMINLRGLSAAVIGARLILYIGLDTSEDAEKVLNILQQL